MHLIGVFLILSYQKEKGMSISIRKKTTGAGICIHLRPDFRYFFNVFGLPILYTSHVTITSTISCTTNRITAKYHGPLSLK